jgi:hypothetical protein
LATVARTRTARPFTSTCGSRATILPSNRASGTASTVIATVPPGASLVSQRSGTRKSRSSGSIRAKATRSSPGVT